MQILLPHLSGTMSPAGVADLFDWPEHIGPWVRGVMVATADGAARGPSGLSAGISSAADRLVFSTIRGLADVILVGAKTVREEGYGPVRDRPELVADRTVTGRAARIAIVTGSGDLDPDSQLFAESPEPPILLVPRTLPQDRRTALAPVAEIVEAGGERVDPARAVAALAALGLTRIACEGGPRLLGQLAAAGALDELCLTVTPLLSGGRYTGGVVPPRVLDAGVLPDAPEPVRLIHVIESDGTLFLRYQIGQP